MSEETLQCPECGKLHREGDKVEVRSDGYAISVVCHKHAMWANRKTIKALLASAAIKRELGGEG